jgi:hypothetical protein
MLCSPAEGILVADDDKASCEMGLDEDSHSENQSEM